MLKRLWQLGRSQRWKMWVQLLGQWLSELLVVSVVWAGAQWVLTDRVAPVWGWLIGAQVVLTLVYFSTVRRLTVRGWAVTASRELQDQYLRAYLTTTATTDDSVMTVLHQDLSTLKRVAIFFDTIIPTIIQLILTGIVLVVVGLAVHPLTVLIPFAGIVLLGAGMGLLQGLGDRTNLAFIKSFNQMGQRFLDDFAGMATLVMYGRQRQYAADFQHDTENFRQKTMGVLKYQLQSLTIMDFCLYGAIGFFGLAQVSAVQAGRLALPTASGLTTLTALWLIDFRKFGYFMHVFMSTLPKVKHLFAIIDGASATKQVNAPALAPVKTVTITGQVGYQTPLFNVDQLTLSAGQLIGLTGPSGSGKSTLAAALMQQQPLLTGHVVVNGTTDLTTITPASWRQRVVYLGPNPVLFDGTIADNLLMGHDQPDWQARLADRKLCQFVTALPAGFATPVGENGAQLSPGQRQQVALARAVLADKDVYVFDEVTSNIDPDNANQIMAVIQQLAQTKVVLLITHRLADLQHLSRLYLVDDHRLVAGTLTSLQTTVPAFHRLVAAEQQLLREAGIQ